MLPFENGIASARHNASLGCLTRERAKSDHELPLEIEAGPLNGFQRLLNVCRFHATAPATGKSGKNIKNDSED
jgi:hypothetical protein